MREEFYLVVIYFFTIIALLGLGYLYLRLVGG